MTKIRILGVEEGNTYPLGIKDTWEIKYKHVTNGQEGNVQYMSRILKSEAVDELAAYMWFVKSMNNVHYEVVTDE